MSFKNKNIEWYNDQKYNFYFDNYSNCLHQWENSNSKTNQFLKSYNKIFSASKQANKDAFLTILNYTNNKNLEPISDLNQAKKIKKTRKTNIQFELDNELIKFYEESLRFKKEKQEKEKKQLKEYGKHVKGEQVELSSHEISSSAPFERAGTKREEELKNLYGNNSSKIHLMETKLQMKYDKNFDLYQPKYWPSFPLKIKFD